jgi:hypothetical protein
MSGRVATLGCRGPASVSCLDEQEGIMIGASAVEMFQFIDISLFFACWAGIDKGRAFQI